MNTKELVLGFYEILKTPLEGKEVTMQKAKKCAELLKFEGSFIHNGMKKGKSFYSITSDKSEQELKEI